MKFIIPILLTIVSTANAVNVVVCWDTNNHFLVGFFNGDFEPSVYSGKTNCEFDPDLSGVQSVFGQKQYWKRTAPGTWNAMTAQEQIAIDAAMVAASTNSVASQALLGVDAFDSVSLAQRGFALVSLDEINNLWTAINELNKWRSDTSTTVAAASSLANFQTRWATLEPAPAATSQRTPTQLKNAVKTKISNGGAD